MKINGTASVDDATRRRVMRYVMERGRATATQLADEFSLTQAAIRRHLSALESDGMLAQRQHSPHRGKQGAGRPSKEYVATDLGRQDFDHAYDELAIDAVETLRKVGGEEAVLAFFEERFTRIEKSFAELSESRPDLPSAEVLALVLNEDGFMSGLVPVASGEQLCQHHCPYSAVAERFPELCSAETTVFSKLLSSHVQRLATIAHGDGVCTMHIPASPTSVSIERRYANAVATPVRKDPR